MFTMLQIFSLSDKTKMEHFSGQQNVITLAVRFEVKSHSTRRHSRLVVLAGIHDTLERAVQIRPH